MPDIDHLDHSFIREFPGPGIALVRRHAGHAPRPSPGALQICREYGAGFRFAEKHRTNPVARTSVGRRAILLVISCRRESRFVGN